jgi:hypothetical protein
MFKTSAMNLRDTPLIETMTGTKTLTVGSPRVMALDPDGNRNLVMPAEELCHNGDVWFVRNTANAAEIITIQTDAGGTICTPTQNESAVVFMAGQVWYGLVAFHN